ncbi:MAG: CsbD family protein [Gammaproteobacteria bacterium]|jgi:uncharacterized protein YjbJ (UPF0337 family)|nr:CsbD family protein [Gammaproteobacteria bacterium]
MAEETWKGRWNQMKGQAKQEWGKLTEDDMQQAEGKKDDLIGRIQERYGVAKDEAERQVDKFLSKIRS